MQREEIDELEKKLFLARFQIYDALEIIKKWKKRLKDMEEK